MTAQSTRSYSKLAFAIIIAALVISGTVLASSYFGRATTVTNTETDTVTTSTTATTSTTNTLTTTSTTSSTTSSTSSTSACLIAPGQPQGAFFRVLYDSNSSSVVGASVVAIPTASYGCPVTQETFTTNGTEWYSLNYLNSASILIFVNYQGSDYNTTMRLELSVWNCGTLYLPSDSTDETFSPEISCALTATSTNSSSTSASISTSTSSSTSTQSTTIFTPTGTTCTGYPPAPDCQGLINYNFTISVAYVGSWNISYSVYDNAGTPLGSLASGNYTGTGDSSNSVTLIWYNYQYLTLCASATKLDGSDATLTLGVTGSNSTTAPYGSVTYCSGAAA
jgi:hypothetical protein